MALDEKQIDKYLEYLPIEIARSKLGRTETDAAQ